MRNFWSAPLSGCRGVALGYRGLLGIKGYASGDLMCKRFHKAKLMCNKQCEMPLCHRGWHKTKALKQKFQLYSQLNFRCVLLLSPPLLLRLLLIIASDSRFLEMKALMKLQSVIITPQVPK